MGKRTTGRKRATPTQDFTDRKLETMGYRRTQVVGQNRVDAPRRWSCRAMGWTWLPEAERGAIVRYWDLREEAQVSVPGCLTPKEGSAGGTYGPQRISEKASQLRHVEGRCSAPELQLLRQALHPESPNDFDEFALAKFGPPREAARLSAKGMVFVAARQLAAIFGA